MPPTGSTGRADDSPAEAQIRDRAIRLFKFLRGLSELRMVPVRQVDDYESVLWFHEVPASPGIVNAPRAGMPQDDAADVWLEIPKPDLQPYPAPPTALAPWLDPKELRASAREDVPALRDHIINMRDDGTQASTSLDDAPDIKRLYQEYVDLDWWPWAEEDRRRQAVQRVYTQLFSMYKRQQQLGEQYELVIGQGLLVLRTPAGLEIRRHLVTAQPSLSFDAGRGILTVGPGGEGARPRLEQDMLDVPDRPAPALIGDLEQRIGEVGDAVWGTGIPELLREWVHTASPRGRYEASLEPPRQFTNDHVVHFAPALILRKRQERSLVRMFTEISKQIQQGGSVPLGIRRLVAIEDDRVASDDSGDGAEATDTDPGDIYFPLPANDQQRDILAQLAARQGLLVQGPPGTGKSHTIANLIAHLLATGQRVLVTSHTARALRALRDKIPAAIAPLCVLLLGEDLNARQALEDSVRGITDRHNQWDAARADREIVDAERRLHEARMAEARAMQTLRDLRALETKSHELTHEAYAGTAQAIASRLCREEPQFVWLRQFSPAETSAPLSNADAAALARLIAVFSPADEQELQQSIVPLDGVVSPDIFDALSAEEANAGSAYEAASPDRAHPAYTALVAMAVEDGQSLRGGLAALLEASRRLAQSAAPWVRTAMEQTLAGQRQVWDALATVTRRELEELEPAVSEVSMWTVSGLDGRDLSVVQAQAAALFQHLDAGKGLGLGPFRAKVVRDALPILRDIRVNGRGVQSTGALRDLLTWIRVSKSLEVLAARWKVYQDPPTGPFDLQAAGYRDLLGFVDAIVALAKDAERLRALCGRASVPHPRWEDPGDVERLSRAVAAVETEVTWRECQARLDGVGEALRQILRHDGCHPVVRDLDSAVSVKDATRYRRAYGQLRALWDRRTALEHRNTFLDCVRATAPRLAEALLTSREAPAWNERLSALDEAWAWVQVDRWLARLCDPEALSLANEAARQARRAMLIARGELAAAKAWRHCLSGLNEPQRQHLKAWQHAMSRYGKGKGKYAASHLRDAREHMDECRAAIPAWVMPIYKVLETVRAGTDSFDVVIVDEASQSGPEALFLNYLAAKIIVVGDEQQISPEHIGINHEDVSQLRAQYIDDLPHKDTLGVDTSFFTQAEIRYSGHVRLLEHFRCMPEIIQFSNNLCYQSNPLIPLRQYGTDRLEPVVVAQRVLGGYVTGRPGHLVNPVEAEVIVGKIVELCGRPEYEDKTMGVISLLGEDQAKLIERLLMERVGPEIMERRRLVCGDAYAFQGDERHVMFLSMVSAESEEHRIGPLTRDTDKRRFNVAASRAQDQMWLFYSVDPPDLSPVCLRRRLLEYCQAPRVDPTAVPGLNDGELRALAADPVRRRLRAPEPFDSWFEVDVFLKLADRKYRVLPQHEVGTRRIDLVVEGMRGRLAVECDGDDWHGPDVFDEDMARQRDLERCGWAFWRVRGSTYYRNPDAALASLWDTLDRLSIFPEGGEGAPVQANGRPSASLHELEPLTLGSASQEPLLSPADREDESETEDTEFEQDIVAAVPGPSAGGTSEAHTVGTAEPNGEAAAEVIDAPPLSRVAYTAWPQRPLPDPRAARRQQVRDALLEIIAAEGPMPCHRSYRLYAKAAGVAKVGRQVRSAFNRAVYDALRHGLLEERNEYETRDQVNQVVRVTNTPTVRLREPGGRTLFEVPPSELGEMMRQLTSTDRTLRGEALLRAVARQYGVDRMSARMRQLLEFARNRFGPPA